MDIFGIPITDEMAEHLDHENMKADSYRHDIQRMFEELPKEHLFTLKLLFSHFSQDKRGRLAAYYEGVVAATIVSRFDVCGACGKDHSEAIESLKDSLQALKKNPDDTTITPKPSKSTPKKPSTKGTTLDDAPMLFEDSEELEKVLQESEQYPLTNADLLNMKLYNLDDLREEDDHSLVGFICKGCGLRYESIEDRMLRPVDACHGCYLKAAHG